MNGVAKSNTRISSLSGSELGGRDAMKQWRSSIESVVALLDMQDPSHTKAFGHKPCVDTKGKVKSWARRGSKSKSTHFMSDCPKFIGLWYTVITVYRNIFKRNFLNLL